MTGEHSRATAKQCVQGAYAQATRVFNRRQRTHQVIDRATGAALGVGSTPLAAWRDAAASIERGVVKRVSPFTGASPTMSLKSDEQFWKPQVGAKPRKIVPPT